MSSDERATYEDAREGGLVRSCPAEPRPTYRDQTLDAHRATEATFRGKAGCEDEEVKTKRTGGGTRRLGGRFRRELARSFGPDTSAATTRVELAQEKNRAPNQTHEQGRSLEVLENALEIEHEHPR